MHISNLYGKAGKTNAFRSNSEKGYCHLTFNNEFKAKKHMMQPIPTRNPENMRKAAWSWSCGRKRRLPPCIIVGREHAIPTSKRTNAYGRETIKGVKPAVDSWSMYPSKFQYVY